MRITYLVIPFKVLNIVCQCNVDVNSDDVNVIFNEASSNRTINAVHVDVNLLSAGVDNAVQKIPVNDLIQAQRNDVVIKPVYDAVLAGERRLPRAISSRASRLLFGQIQKLAIENGVLVRKLSTHK